MLFLLQSIHKYINTQLILSMLQTFRFEIFARGSRKILIGRNNIQPYMHAVKDQQCNRIPLQKNKLT